MKTGCYNYDGPGPGTGLTSVQMKQIESLVEWDFNNIRPINPSIYNGYPNLGMNIPTSINLERVKAANVNHVHNLNYPNPFNPTTTIRYEVSKSCFATDKVFDILGKEAATLLNGNKSTEIYSVQFIASGLSSWVYLHIMRVGNFVSIRT